MNKDFINYLAEMKLLSERMDNQYSDSKIEQRRNQLINEMALDKPAFKNYLMSQTTPIIAHFSLIKYAKSTNTHQELLSYWCGELKNFIIDFQEMEIKPKPNKRNIVFKALYETWFKEMNLNMYIEDLKINLRKNILY